MVGATIGRPIYKRRLKCRQFGKEHLLIGGDATVYMVVHPSFLQVMVQNVFCRKRHFKLGKFRIVKPLADPLGRGDLLRDIVIQVGKKEILMADLLGGSFGGDLF